MLAIPKERAGVAIGMHGAAAGRTSALACVQALAESTTMGQLFLLISGEVNNYSSTPRVSTKL